MPEVDFYKIGDTPEELRKALIELRGDFDAHNHDGSNSKSFETLRAESIITRILVSGTPTGTRASITASSFKFYNSTNNLLMTIFGRSIVFKKSDGTANHTIYALDTGLLVQDDDGNLKFEINASPFFYKKLEPLTSDDTIDIGTATSGHRFRTIYLINSPDVSSSKEGKENIQNISYGLDTIMRMRPVSFTRKHKDENYKDDESKTKEITNLGFIAEEMNEVAPEVGTRDSIKPDHIIPILVKAIQELTARVEELEKK